MKKLWQKNWKLDEFIEQFETASDLAVDQKLVIYDVVGSLAHAKMLQKIGILTEKELAQLEIEFAQIISLNESGEFELKMGDEDVHSKIERFLTDKLGEVGKKIHAGRSRNDQVLVTTRLYTRDRLLSLYRQVLDLAQAFQEYAREHEFVPMPGYTHTQKAMPSSVGMWAGAFAEGLLDNLIVLEAAYTLNNQSPLGSAAGFGVPLKLDRAYTAELLGFDRVQKNSLYCQNSRGKIESAVVGALMPILMEINKFATDVLFFTSSDLTYFAVSEEICTGSSIMPQKKNVDVAELIRSKLHLVLGHYSQVVSMAANLISGYNRDLQDLKPQLVKSLEITDQSLTAAGILLAHLSPNEEILAAAVTPEVFATHRALELVKHGVPFREAYQTVSGEVAEPDDSLQPDLEKTLKQSTHPGGTGNLALGELDRQIRDVRKSYQIRLHDHTSALDQLLSSVRHADKDELDQETDTNEGGEKDG